MANRNRTNPVQFYLSDDEQYILNTKFKASGMKRMSAFLRKLILYGYVYDVDYSYLRNYNTELGRISSNLNKIAKRVNSTRNIYQEDINEVKELMNEIWHSTLTVCIQNQINIKIFVIKCKSLLALFKEKAFPQLQKKLLHFPNYRRFQITFMICCFILQSCKLQYIRSM